MKCVYVYLDPRKPGRWETSGVTFLFEPIYIGEGVSARGGKKNKGRAYDHLLFAKGTGVENNMKTNKIRKILKIGLEPIIIILHDDLVGNESVRHETALIKEIGTRAIIDGVSRGPLTNMLLSPPNKRILSEESRSKISKSVSKALLGHKPSEETCRKISAAFNRSEQASKNRSNAQRGRITSEETRAKISKTLKALIRNPTHNEKIGEALRGKSKTEDHKFKLSLTKRKTWKIIDVNGTEELVPHLGLWCDEHSINHESLKTAYRKGKSHKGFMLVSY